MDGAQASDEVDHESSIRDLSKGMFVFASVGRRPVTGVSIRASYAEGENLVQIFTSGSRPCPQGPRTQSKERSRDVPGRGSVVTQRCVYHRGTARKDRAVLENLCTLLLTVVCGHHRKPERLTKKLSRSRMYLKPAVQSLGLAPMRLHSSV